MARTWRPPQRAPVRRAASTTIASGVTASLRKNRVRRISPARSPPRRRTRSPRPPSATRRACKKTPLFPGGDRQTAPDPFPPSNPPSNLKRESERSPPCKQRCVNAVAHGAGAFFFFEVLRSIGRRDAAFRLPSRHRDRFDLEEPGRIENAGDNDGD